MRKFILVSVTAAATLVGALLFAIPSQQSCAEAISGVQHALCGGKVNHSVTWRTWLQGKSRSTQFHFLDLVELMFGDRVSDSGKSTVKSDKKHNLSFQS